jgi:hypothetical protein
VRAQVLLLRQARRDVVKALGSAAGFRTWQLGQILAGIDHELEQYQRMAQAAARGAATSAATYGAQLIPGGLWGVSPELLSALTDVTTDQVRAVWSELGTSLKAQVRRASLGITDQFSSIQVLARAIRDPKTFGRAETRAEVIMRTETGRVFSASSQQSMEQAERSGVTMRKFWLPANDGRTRPTHAAAGVRYNEQHPIKVSKPFIVGGARLMYPHDPAGPAAETINCRCVSVPIVLD